ncbi:MAG: hypothetical protein AAGE59_02195 [Cyanobacteria bacterium P01_F01_bin.86]
MRGFRLKCHASGRKATGRKASETILNSPATAIASLTPHFMTPLPTTFLHVQRNIDGLLINLGEQQNG